MKPHFDIFYIFWYGLGCTFKFIIQYIFMSSVGCFKLSKAGLVWFLWKGPDKELFSVICLTMFPARLLSHELDLFSIPRAYLILLQCISRYFCLLHLMVRFLSAVVLFFIAITAPCTCLGLRNSEYAACYWNGVLWSGCHLHCFFQICK